MAASKILLLFLALVMWVGIGMMVGWAAEKKFSRRFWMIFFVTVLVQALISAMVFMLLVRR
jgi:hypothetical protein